jgi:hypothetical protein
MAFSNRNRPCIIANGTRSVHLIPFCYSPHSPGGTMKVVRPIIAALALAIAAACSNVGPTAPDAADLGVGVGSNNARAGVGVGSNN